MSPYYLLKEIKKYKNIKIILVIVDVDFPRDHSFVSVASAEHLSLQSCHEVQGYCPRVMDGYYWMRKFYGTTKVWCMFSEGLGKNYFLWSIYAVAWTWLKHIS